MIFVQIFDTVHVLCLFDTVRVLCKYDNIGILRKCLWYVLVFTTLVTKLVLKGNPCCFDPFHMRVSCHYHGSKTQAPALQIP